MIWSVSMLAAGSTTVREVSVVKGSIVRPRTKVALHQLARIGDPAAHRAGRGGEGAREEGACARTLAAFFFSMAEAAYELVKAQSKADAPAIVVVKAKSFAAEESGGGAPEVA